MTNPWTYRIKMFLAVAIILVFPQLFMHFVGDNPMQAKEEGKGTRSIAIVNEDLGTEDAESNLQLGREVPAILEDDSEYEWTVLSRSSAVNGLKDKKYDAVVYIPSNFTSNILSYDDTQPAKADFKYTVQTQLNAVNREKILRELNDAGSRVNKQMTSLYWNYVSQDMKKVRNEFDRILEKEIEFQSTMVSFYQPGSKTLSDELERQRDMLVQLQSTIQQADETSPQRAQNLDQFEQNLASFVEYVERYKEYQANQQKLLNEAQQQSILAINNGKESFAARQNESRKVFGEQSDLFQSNMSTINDLLKGNQASITSLNTERLEQAERQKEDMKVIHSDIIDAYQQTELNLIKEQIRNSRSILKQEDGGSNPIPIPESQFTEQFVEQINELDSINEEIGNINSLLTSILEPSKQVTDSIQKLNDLTKRINGVKENLNLWKQKYDLEVKAVYDSFQKELNFANQKPKAELISAITSKETELKNLNPELGIIFNSDLIGGKVEDLISYLAILKSYQTVFEGNNANKQAVLSDQALQDRVGQTLSVNEEEQGKWDELQTKFPVTQQEMKGLGESFTSFSKNYKMSLEEQQLALMEDVGFIEESANTVLLKLQDIKQSEPNETSSGTLLVSNQQNINQEITNLNSLMDSLGERQNSVVSSASDLQVKVSSVQNNATVLNEKWSENVDSTKSVRDDVFDVLGNTYVDGQSNGYVYDYLASPLQVSGDQSQVGTESTKAIPPVVILVVILISSLLIGYFTHYFSTLPFLVKNAMFGLLNLIVGLVISLFGLEIYSLSNNSSIQFSIFTILLLTAASTLVRVGFNLNQFIGWLASMGLILFFVSPLLALAAPNFSYEDPMSTVYMSIQYGTGNEFSIGCFTLVGIIALLSLIPLAAKWWSKPDKKANSDTANEAF